MAEKNMVCPNISSIKGNTRPWQYNFNLAHCQRRFRMRAAGCIRCPEGTHWFLKSYIG